MDRLTLNSLEVYEFSFDTPHQRSITCKLEVDSVSLIEEISRAKAKSEVIDFISKLLAESDISVKDFLVETEGL